MALLPVGVDFGAGTCAGGTRAGGLASLRPPSPSPQELLAHDDGTLEAWELLAHDDGTLDPWELLAPLLLPLGVPWSGGDGILELSISRHAASTSLSSTSLS